MERVRRKLAGADDGNRQMAESVSILMLSTNASNLYERDQPFRKPHAP
jgi:hypothetical protein